MIIFLIAAEQHHSPGPAQSDYLYQQLLRAGDDERWAV
jgi:hypothetical protein